jgi:2-polyprenyl-3-methyl-5-hydroxy-6-metoxy-1,4-benzoquinol methylase
VLDIGTGTGIAAAAARGEGREVIGVDARGHARDRAGPRSRRRLPRMDFTALAFDDAPSTS